MAKYLTTSEVVDKETDLIYPREFYYKRDATAAKHELEHEYPDFTFMPVKPKGNKYWQLHSRTLIVASHGYFIRKPQYVTLRAVQAEEAKDKTIKL